MKKTSFIFFSSLIALAVASGSPFLAKAATSTVNAAEAQTQTQQECNIDETLSAFLAVKDKTGNIQDIQTNEEFQLEKELLEKIISCMKSEINSMNSILSNLKDLEPELSQIRDELIETLIQYLNWLSNAEQNLHKIAELKEIKLFAKGLLKWREEEYLPQVQEMLTLSYIVRSRDLLKIASIRQDKIRSAIKTLGLSGNFEIKTLLEKSAKKLKESENLNKQALELFLVKVTSKQKSNEEVGSTTSTVAIDMNQNESAATTSVTSTPKEAEPNELPDPKNLAKEALLRIRDTYRIFINIGEIVRRLI
jgi:hypothetical protein